MLFRELTDGKCVFCGQETHKGVLCVYVHSIEFFENGDVKTIGLEDRQMMEKPGNEE